MPGDQFIAWTTNKQTKEIKATKNHKRNSIFISTVSFKQVANIFW